MTADDRIKQLEAEVAHWKANHANEVRRARILKDRPDMPIERVRAYEQWGADRERLVAEIERKMSAAAFILKQLAASQAREAKLREALEWEREFQKDQGREVSVFGGSVLAQPSDTTALEAVIAKTGEVMRERCCKVLFSNPAATEIAIRALPGVTLDDIR